MTDAGSEFQTDGVAHRIECFAKSVRVNGWVSSDVAVKRSVCVLTRRLMRWLRYHGTDVFRVIHCIKCDDAVGYIVHHHSCRYHFTDCRCEYCLWCAAYKRLCAIYRSNKIFQSFWEHGAHCGQDNHSQCLSRWDVFSNNCNCFLHLYVISPGQLFARFILSWFCFSTYIVMLLIVQRPLLLLLARNSCC